MWHECIYNQHKFIGTSIAGVRTCIACPEFDLAFDAAQGLPFALPINRFLISHGHMDHASGIPYIISQKALVGQKPADFYMPESLVKPLSEIISLWQKIEGHQYNFRFHAVDFNQEYQLNRDHFFRAFPTVHRIPSCGYTVFRRTKRLKSEFQGLGPNELAGLRKAGRELSTYFVEPLISFTGDTKIEFLELTPWVRKSQILMMEVTYVDEKKSVKTARDWGHIHLDELLPWLDQLECQKIVLLHLSSRYRKQDVESVLDQRLSAEQRARIEVF